jgi:RNA polymerase sigma factor (sigma-70 family)
MSESDLWWTAARALVPDAAGVTDADLLARFRDTRDQAAFELLVYRHGPMVWSACCRLVRDRHAAEDAFQATFLALTRRAQSINHSQSVAAWLHRVAVRAGLCLHRRARNRPVLLGSYSDGVDPRPNPREQAERTDAASDIDAAVNRLPERLRRVVVLCELRGQSLRQAAAELRCPVGTVASRLARARQRLRVVLTTTGIVSGWAVVQLVPPAVRAATLRVATGTGVSPAVSALAKQAGRPAARGTFLGLSGALAIGLITVAFALGGTDEPRSVSKSPAKDAPPTAATRTDADGVPLPDGAIARLGSRRFRHDGPGGTQAAFSTDGRYLAGATGRGIYVWEVPTGRRAWHFPTPDDHSPSIVRFLDGGTRLAVGSMDYRGKAELNVFDLTTGKVAEQGPFHGQREIRISDVSPDGSRVLVNDRAAKIYLWDRTAGKELWAVPTAGSTFALPITADGKKVGTVRTFGGELRDTATGEVAGKFPNPTKPFWNGHTATLAPDGRLAVCSYDDETVGVYETGKADPVHTFRTEPRTDRLFFSPDLRYLAGCAESMTRVWDLRAAAGKELVARLPGTGGAFSRDSKTLALDTLGALTLWKAGEWVRLPQSADPPSGVKCIRFAPDGKRVFGHTVAGWVAWPTTGGPAERLSDDSETDPRGLADVSADGRAAVDVLYKPPAEGKAAEYTMRATDLRSGTDHRFPIPADPWWPVIMSDDGRFICRLGSKDVTAWDAATGGVVYRKGHAIGERFPQAVQLTADGSGLRWSLACLLASAGDGGPGSSTEVAAFVTDHVHGREWKMTPAPLGVSRGQFSPDGTRLVICARFKGSMSNGGVSVWDTATGRQLCAVPSVSGYSYNYPLSPDGRGLLVGSNDGTVRCVEVATGGERAVFRHVGVVLSVAFHPDGTKAASSSPDGPVYVWDLLGDPGQWSKDKADAVWADLSSGDAKVAFASVRLLRANSAAAISFLNERVRVPTLPAEDAVAALLKRLDGPRFPDREKAQKELMEIAELFRPRLEAARKLAREEAGRRLDQVLKTIDEPTSERLRQIRACEVLEGIGNSDAVRLLRTWAAGPAGSRLATEATESLARLKK